MRTITTAAIFTRTSRIRISSGRDGFWARFVANLSPPALVVSLTGVAETSATVGVGGKVGVGGVGGKVRVSGCEIGRVIAGKRGP